MIRSARVADGGPTQHGSRAACLVRAQHVKHASVNLVRTAMMGVVTTKTIFGSPEDGMLCAEACECSIYKNFLQFGPFYLA